MGGDFQLGVYDSYYQHAEQQLHLFIWVKGKRTGY